MTSKFKGYTLGVIAAATYGMNPLFTLPLYKEGMDPNSVLFFRYLMALPIVAVMIKARRRDFCVNPRQLLPLSVLGLLMGLSSLALFVSYNYMEASIASTMLFVYPIMVALIMAVVYHEKLTLQTVICLTMAIAGIIILVAGLLFIEPIAKLSGADTENMAYTCDYLKYVFIGAPFIILSNGAVHLFRSLGFIKESTIGLALGNSVNIVLDFVFIVLLRRGTASAALATSLGFFCSTVYYLICLIWAEKKETHW